jgi:hypothetical protein
MTTALKREGSTIFASSARNRRLYKAVISRHHKHPMTSSNIIQPRNLAPVSSSVDDSSTVAQYLDLAT